MGLAIVGVAVCHAEDIGGLVALDVLAESRLAGHDGAGGRVPASGGRRLRQVASHEEDEHDPEREEHAEEERQEDAPAEGWSSWFFAT